MPRTKVRSSKVLMIARLCRILIAVALAAHLMVGCCSHHAHGCEASSSSDDHQPISHEQPVNHEGCHESGIDHSNHDTNDCQGPSCSFVSPGRVAPDFPMASFALGAKLPGDLQDDSGILLTLPLASGRLLLPVRLHLANQVLLI